MKLKLALCLLLPLNLWAATWERPAGAYTPTNNSVNITKYQLLSAARGGIPSASIDGDINKAFQGLNDLESRTPPSVTGNSGKFLTNNGTATSWGLVTVTGISSGAAAAGTVLQSNGIGGVGFGTVSASALGNSGVTSGTYTIPTFSVNNVGLVVSATSNNTPTLGGLTVSGTITATAISVSNAIVTSLTVGSISGSGAYKAMVIFTGSSSPTTVHRAENVSAVNRTGTSTYNIIGSFPSVPGITCQPRGFGGSTGGIMSQSGVTPTASLIAIRTYNTATGADEAKDYISCQIF